MARKKSIATSEPALFSTEQYSSGIGDIERSPFKDPYWDKIILDSEITQTDLDTANPDSSLTNNKKFIEGDRTLNGALIEKIEDERFFATWDNGYSAWYSIEDLKTGYALIAITSNSSLAKVKAGAIYFHFSSGKRVKVHKVLKSKATGFVEVYFENDPILERVAIADLAEITEENQSCSRTLRSLPESVVLNSELKLQEGELSPPEFSLKTTHKPNKSLTTDSPKLSNTQTLETGNQVQENINSTQLDFPVQVQVLPETDQDLNTQNQVCGLKLSDVLPMAAPVSSSLKILQDLSITDYDQFLGDSEWLDIVGTIRKSYQQRNSAHPMKGKDYSLLPTPTTYPKGSGKCRPAGTNRLEQKLSPFINKGDKLHPAIAGWMMGFPSGWVERSLADTGELLSVQPPLIPLQATTSTTAATVLTSTDEPLHHSKQQSLLNESVTLQNSPELLTPTNTDKQTTTHNKPWYEGKFNVGDQVVWQKYPDLIYEIVKPEKGGHVVIELKSDSKSAISRKRVAVIYLTPITATARFSPQELEPITKNGKQESEGRRQEEESKYFSPSPHLPISPSSLSPVSCHLSPIKPTFKTGEYVLNGRVGEIIEDSPGEYFVVKYSLINSNDLKCYFWGQDDELIDQIVIASPELIAQFVRENKEASEQEVKTKKTKTASGSLAPFLENKKLKDGTIVTYPRVHGERDKLNYDHWRWGYYYEVKVNGEWKNKSLPVPARIAPLVREMIDKDYPVEEIKSFILQCKNKKGGGRID